MHFLLPLILTIAIELLVLLGLRERQSKILLASVAINIVTNLPLNIALSIIGYDWIYILIGELLVLIIEALWYILFTKNIKQAAIYSLLCNVTSYLTGLLIQLIVIQV